MKIERGYTLSQFIDLIERETIAKETVEENLFLSFKYNDFLKQPLKKEMFVNPYEEPNQEDMEGDTESYKIQYKQWQEVEKKVIFHPSIFTKYNISFCLCEETGKLDVILTNHLESFMCKTLSDLFQATNGKLEIKNLEL